MKTSTKKLVFASILVAALAVSNALIYVIYFLEKPATDEVLTFLEEVAGIDTTKYEVTIFDSSVTYPDELGGLEQLSGKYALESETSKLDVPFKFRNGTLSWCIIRNIEGKPHYTENPSANLHNAVCDFMQKYQQYSDDSDFETLKNMLDSVDATENSTTTADNMKLIVTVTSLSTSFDWRHTLNGAEYSKLCVSFKEHSLFSFSANKSGY